MAAGALISAGCLALATSQAQAAPTDAKAHVLKGSVAPEISGHPAIGAAAASQTRTVQLWLKPKAAAESFATAVSTPGSLTYRHFLTPDQYTQAYGAGSATIKQVRSWLTGHGFSHLSTDSQHNYVSAQAPVSTVQKAFSVKINKYRVTGPDGTQQTVTSNDRDITLPAALGSDVSAVTGLDTIQPRTFHSARPTTAKTAAAQAATAEAAAADPDADCSTYYGQKTKTGLPKYKGSTSFPYVGCGYTAKQLRAAYGMNTANNGAGQTIAYIEIGTPYRMLKSLKRYATLGGLPAPKSTSYNELTVGDDVNNCGNAFDVEEQLDVEAGYTTAPGAKHLLVGGDGCNLKYGGVQALLDAELAVLDGSGSAPFATIESNSWGLTGEAATSALTTAMHSILVRAAAEGVGMYFSSGDNPGLSQPADDSLAISVGGTSLGIGAKDQRLFETGWSNEELDLDGKKYDNEGIGRSAAGGGASLLYAQPAYQAGVVPKKVAIPPSGDSTQPRRTVPDLSAVADAYTGIQQVDVEQTDKGKDFYDIFPDGGTSLSSPLVAGIMADVQQGGVRLGFVNPTLYSLAGTAAWHDTLAVTKSTPASRSAVYCPPTSELCWEGLETLDSQDRVYTDQSTTKGYDTMTGLGTPNGQTFINALRTAATQAP
ncbi:S53 family peptidase [Microlunatus endophyticus]